MKKLLTIIALSLTLCLLFSAVLAEQYADLSGAQSDAVASQWKEFEEHLEKKYGALPDSPSVIQSHKDEVVFTVTKDKDASTACVEVGTIEIDFLEEDFANPTKPIEYKDEAHKGPFEKYWVNDADESEVISEKRFDKAKYETCANGWTQYATCEKCGEEFKTGDVVEQKNHENLETAYFYDEECEVEIEGTYDAAEKEFTAGDVDFHWLHDQGYFYRATVCRDCGTVITKSIVKVTYNHGHTNSVRHFYVLKNGVRIYHDDDPDAFHENMCTGEVWYVWGCWCGARFDKTEKLYDARNHRYGTEVYEVIDTATGNHVAWLSGGINEQEELCNTVYTNQTLVKVKFCENECPACQKDDVCFADKEDSIGAGRKNPITGALGHKWATGNANEAAHWAKVIKQPTCREEGLAVSYCEYCGQENWNKQYLLATVPHDFSIKEYNTAAGAAPTCKNGLTVMYALKCRYCCEHYNANYYEGGLIYPNYNHPEKLTPVELINLDMAWRLATATDFEYSADDPLLHEAWHIATDIDGKPTYDADGHFYIPTVTVARKYACEPNRMQYYSCVFCGKEKLVIHETAHEYDAPDYKLIKTEEIDGDPTHVKQTWQCRICNGEFEPHTYTKIVDKACKHHWIYDNDSLVLPTCTAKGSIAKECDICGKKDKDSIAATGHFWGEWKLETSGLIESPVPPVNSKVYIRTCQVCNATESKIVPPGEGLVVNAEVWKRVPSKDVKADCQTKGEEVWQKFTVNANGEEKATDEYRSVVTGIGDHIMAHKTELDVPATCTSNGIEYYVCTVCGSYEPTTKEFIGYWEKKIVEGGHKWGEWTVTKEATTEAAGVETRICSVCKTEETREIAKVVGEAAYKLSDIKFAGTVLTGKITHAEGTKEADKLSIRVTFFTAGNHYMTTSAVIYADGTFEAEGAGDIEAITLVAYATDKVVNPADVANLTKLDAKEIVVK